MKLPRATWTIPAWAPNAHTCLFNWAAAYNPCVVTPPRIYLSLGSNVGDRLANLRAAIAALPGAGVSVRKISSIYETEPVDLIEQPWFLNCVVEAETNLQPLALLHALRAIEYSMGSKKLVAKGPRIIDLDILLYAEQVGIRGAADVAVLRGIAAAADARIEVTGDLRAADMQARKDTGSVVVNEIEVTVIAVVFAPGDQTKIGVIALVGDDETTPGGEITGSRLHVSGYNGGVLDAQNKE